MQVEAMKARMLPKAATPRSWSIQARSERSAGVEDMSSRTDESYILNSKSGVVWFVKFKQPILDGCGCRQGCDSSFSNGSKFLKKELFGNKIPL